MKYLQEQEENSKSAKNLPENPSIQLRQEVKNQSTVSENPYIEHSKEQNSIFTSEVINTLKEYVNSNQYEDLERYITRILSQAFIKDIPAPIEDLISQIEKKFKIKINGEKGKIIHDLQKQSILHGYQISNNFIADSRKQIAKNIAKQNTNLPNKLKNKDSQQLNKLSISSDINEIITYLELQGFEFHNTNSFIDQFDSLVITSKNSQIKEKSIRVLNGELAQWQKYRDDYYVLKIDIGKTALRIVRKGKIILDFLNHTEYEKKYRKIIFGS